MIDYVPYTDYHTLNLDWLVKQVKDQITKYESLETFVNSTVEEQNAKIEQALREVSKGMKEIMTYINENLRTIANEIINQLIDSGELYIGTTYNAETEELNIVLTREGE